MAPRLPSLDTLWLRLNRPVSVGITARLGFSFVAVAVLAAAANLIVQRGVAVIHTQHRRADISLALPALPAGHAEEVHTLAISAPPHVSRLERLDAPDPAHFWVPLERYKRAVEVRASLSSPDATLEAQAATSGLDDIVKAHDGSGNALVARTQAYESAGADRILIADGLRSSIEAYVARTDGMDHRLKASLDGAIKLFGRVLARQSLMQLHAKLDDIRHRFAQLTEATMEPDRLAALVTAEGAFADTLTTQTPGFTRSEGALWVRQMSDDFSSLVELRQAITQLDARALDSARRFDAARMRLAESIPRARAAAARTVSPPILDAIKAPEIAPLAIASPIATPLASPLLETTTTTTTGPDPHERQAVAWITAAVLMVLLMISGLTVRSIVVPVREMQGATERIASGDVDVRVTAGGIKELDTLGMSFNRMAAELAAARDMTRDYQLRLEEKVEQRTRQLQHLAEHDPLTHLPNRRQLFVLLNHALERAAQNRRHVAVFFMDIDNFKNLNDSMGHAFGDRVLTEIAERLKTTAQSFGFAGRLGGDEFTVVYEDAESDAVLAHAGGQLVEIFARPLLLDGREVVVRASVGASLYPEHGHRAEDLLSAADAALFQAKALGRAQLAVFTPELLATATRKFTIEQGLRRAIDNDEFELVFQPEVSLASMDMVLVESLLRWRLPDGRQAPPGEFLAVTEESGLIIEVGNWVLRKAIETAAAWHHGDWPEARVAINVSPRQLLDPHFVAGVSDLLQKFNLPPSCIELELTESVLQSGPTTLDSLRRLRALDIAIALDDFGTGYSSLASLENLPLTRIKLDRSLIASIDSNPRSAAITTALIGLCKDLGLEVTAEGIERPEQFMALAPHRFIHLQGYLISRPIAGAAVLEVKRRMPAMMQDLLLSEPAARSQTWPVRIGRRPSLASAAVRG